MTVAVFRLDCVVCDDVRRPVVGAVFNCAPHYILGLTAATVLLDMIHGFQLPTSSSIQLLHCIARSGFLASLYEYARVVV